MATISYISSGSGAGNSISLPAHQTGDLIIGFGHNNSGNGSVTVSSGSGWTDARTTSSGFMSSSGGSTARGAFSVMYNIATSSAVTATWNSNTTHVGYLVFRTDGDWILQAGGIWQEYVVGTYTSSSANATTITYPELSTTRNAGTTYWYARAGGANLATNVTTNNPSGWTFRTGVASKGLALRDSNGPISVAANSVGGNTQAVSPTGGWWAVSAIIAAVDKPVPPGNFFQFF